MAVKRTRKKGGTVVSVEEFLSLERPKGDLQLKIGREQVSVTSLDRIYWPDEKLTKFDLLSYYLKIADYIMPYLRDRPAILQRWPRGIKAPMFFQQDLDTARRVTGKDIPVRMGPRRPGDPAVLIASSDKIKKDLGWQPQFQDLGMIIESAWRWMQNHGYYG